MAELFCVCLWEDDGYGSQEECAVERVYSDPERRCAGEAYDRYSAEWDVYLECYIPIVRAYNSCYDAANCFPAETDGCASDFDASESECQRVSEAALEAWDSCFGY